MTCPRCWCYASVETMPSTHPRDLNLGSFLEEWTQGEGAVGRGNSQRQETEGAIRGWAQTLREELRMRPAEGLDIGGALQVSEQGRDVTDLRGTWATVRDIHEAEEWGQRWPSTYLH